MSVYLISVGAQQQADLPFPSSKCSSLNTNLRVLLFVYCLFLYCISSWLRTLYISYTNISKLSLTLVSVNALVSICNKLCRLAKSSARPEETARWLGSR